MFFAKRLLEGCLAMAGRDVMIAEKATFPRERLYGLILLPRALSPAVQKRCKSARSLPSRTQVPQCQQRSSNTTPAKNASSET